MIRILIVILLTLGTPFLALAQGTRAMNEVSIVALIITSNGATPVSASVTHTLESLDAQTLTADAPNASEMRSILKRFTAAAIDIDVALVYFDGAVLKIGGRDFVAPGGIELRRSTDLLTKAIPLSALARATALAGSGGAVLVHSSGQNIDLIDGISLGETAPEPRTGTSPILFATADAAARLAEGLEALAETDQDIDLSDALRGLAELDGVSISQLPAKSTMLRVMQRPEPVPASVATEPEAENADAPASDAEESQGMVLPQVGADTSEPATEAAPEAMAAPEAETTEAAAAENSDVAAAPAAPVEETASEPAVEEPELSLDVLRAMQGGLSRSDKRVVQRSLHSLGFYRGLIDGIFGRQTERAITSYQESIGANETGVLTQSQLHTLSE